MHTHNYPAAGTPAATDVVLAHGYNGRGWRRLGSIGEVIALVALLPAGVIIAGFVVMLIKWAASATGN